MPDAIKHLVVLMMENRSFDHMLGYLKTADYAIDGLNGDETNPTDLADPPTIRVSPTARSNHDLIPDPNHEFLDVNWQIFRNSDGSDTGQPKMQGFVENYAQISNAVQGRNAMKAFHPGSLPVLSKLAKEYAVCDRWFSSVPGSTIPNRLFAHAASSGGSATQDAVLSPATTKTIFQVIDDPNNDANWAIYTNGASILMANIYLAHHQNNFFDFSQFETHCKKGLLMEYTFIEPSYDDDLDNGTFATSQHPDFAVDAGEALIGQVYNSLVQCPSWKDTLLLIVYDEHGGLYDHVTPPTLTADPSQGDVPASDAPPFKFDRLGVRVPAVFVSPRIPPGKIIHTQYDHCSIVATVRKLFCNQKTPFNWREAQAATFDDICTLSGTNIRADVQLPQPVVSDGTIPLVRPLILSAADRQQSDQARVAQGGIVGAVPSDAKAVAASAPPVQPANQRKPTDLTVLMAKAMAHTLSLMGESAQRSVLSIHTAQDAVDYLSEAASVIQQRGTQRG
ncbi:MAG: alkaline phosphatase family protein [Terracidiphilus sp.]